MTLKHATMLLLRGVRTCAWWLCAWTPVHATAAEPAALDKLGAPIVVIDQRGEHVPFLRSPRRIVSLLPSLTETVCALDACERLVAVDRASNEPASVRRLPNVGGLQDTNLEAIVALSPDLVLAATSTRGLDRMRQLGLQVLAFEPQSQAQAEASFLALAPLLGVSDAKTRWQAMMAPLESAAALVPAHARGWRTYVEVASGPYAASAASFMGDMVRALGLNNVVPATLGPFPKLNPEFVVRSNPQLIIVTASDLQDLRKRPGWRAVDAVRHERVCVLKGSDADVFSRPGPRWPQAAALIVNCMRRFPA